MWPAEMPEEANIPKYRDTSVSIHPLQLGLKEGEPTDPQRFDAEDLMERKASYGRARVTSYSSCLTQSLI